MQAAGLTPMQLRDEIAGALTKFISQPQVTVVVSAINSRRVYLMGEVVRSGWIPLPTSMTVLEALAASGGFSPYANLKNIYVLRYQNGSPVKYPFNYKEVVSGKHTEQNIALQPGDNIVVP
jgi:polysaccharide export outer membrane protein